MPSPVVVEQSRAASGTPAKVFAAALDIPLPALLPRRYGPFPPIKAVRDQTGWAKDGDSRVIVPARLALDSLSGYLPG